MQKYLYGDLYDLEESHWWHMSKRRVVINCIQNYLKKKNTKILDIGCGTGKNLEGLKKFGMAYGLDNSKEAIAFCKKRGLKNLKLGKAEKIPFKSNSFNIITLLDLLEHTDDNKTLQEVYRVLEKNGLLIITVPAFSWLWSDWDKVLHHKKRYNKNDVINILKKNNFTVVYITYLYSFLVLPALIIRRIKQKFSQKKEYTSDFRLSNNFLNWIMNYLTKIEFQIAQKVPIPIGTSILIVAKK